MNDEPPSEAQIHSESTLHEHGDGSTSAFFPNAQHFVIAGGQFNNITNISPPAPAPSDFRRIPLGDLDLRNEIRLDNDNGAVYRRPSVKRVYSARIYGSKSPMTVAIYQGANAEEAWRQDVLQYSWLRHPNFLQLYATASSSGVHAAVFHDELILAKELLEKYRGSHLSTAYIYSLLDREFNDAVQYCKTVNRNYLSSQECTIWIRPSTGRVCVELTPSNDARIHIMAFSFDSPSSRTPSPLEPHLDSKAIAYLSLDRYDRICSRYFTETCWYSIATNASVQMGAVVRCSPGLTIEPSNEIAVIPDAVFFDVGWSAPGGASMVVMESGWTRGRSCEIVDGFISLWIQDGGNDAAWLVQANQIFSGLGITSNEEEYVCVGGISYQLTLSSTGNNMPSGYLFLCPLADLQGNTPSHFRYPECPAYWSLDPSGAERLGKEEADQLGFPSLELKMKALASSWNQSVYTGVRQFHQAKGYDPLSQDVARELGYPLFEASTDLEAPFAHIQETDGHSYDHFEAEATQSNKCPPEASSTVGLNSPERLSPYTRVDADEPSRNWRIIMGVQFALIVTLGILWLCDSFPK